MSIKLKGSSDGSVSLDAPADTSPSGSDITLTLPTSAGSANQFLKNSGIAGELEYSGMVETSTGVGIGESSPDSILHVTESNSGGNTEFIIQNSATASDSNCQIHFKTNAGGNEKTRALITAAGNTGSAGDLIFSNRKSGNTTESMRIDSSGRLLVGTTSSVNAGSTASAMLQVEHSSGSVTGALYCTADTAQGGTLVLGHGRGSATGVLQSGDTLGDIRFAGADGTDLQTQGARISGVVDGTPGSNDMPGRLVFSTTADGASSPSERMRLDQGGSQQNYRSSAGTVINSRTGQSGFSASTFRGYESASSITTGTVSFVVYANGNVQNKNNSYGQISDVKLKENIVDANSQWDDLKAFRIRNWNFKTETGYETHTQIGVVAQEVETVSPGLVYETPDRDDEGVDLGTVTKGVNYSVLYMKAVKALQEAQTRIETLESQHADLLARVTALEAA